MILKVSKKILIASHNDKVDQNDAYFINDVFPYKEIHFLKLFVYFGEKCRYHFEGWCYPCSKEPSGLTILGHGSNSWRNVGEQG